MKTLTSAIAGICLSAAAGAGIAADNMKSGDAMMKKDTMTMQECKDHMSMSKKDGLKKDDAMTKKDMMCADMMKKDGMMKPGMAASEPMMKK